MGRDRTVPQGIVDAAALVLADDQRLVEALRNREEAVFAALVEQYHQALVRLALVYVRTRAVAEEVAQETWLGVLQGIDRFEGRSSLKTWIFRILTNRARTRGEREHRSIPFSALSDLNDDETAVDPDRFFPPGHDEAGHWASPPRNWNESPEERLLAEETQDRVRSAIAALPPNQRAVITLRDVEGWSSDEACALLGLSEGNQRVILHRARSRVRNALETYLAGAPAVG